MLLAVNVAHGEMTYYRSVLDTQPDASYVEAGTVARGSSSSAWVLAHERAQDRLLRAATACRRAGIEEARIAMAQTQADDLVSVLREFVRSLGLDPVAEAAALTTALPALLTWLAGQAG